MPSPPDGSDLCTACGLCCTGLLFDVAPLEEHELPLAERLRLPLASNQYHDAFRLPCPHLDGRRCGVYESRPTVCGSYECGLLRRFKAGEVALEEALDRVHGVTAQVAALRDRVPAGPAPQPLWDDARDLLRGSSKVEREELVRALAELRAALRRDLDP